MIRIITLLAVILFALVHIIGGKLRFLAGTPRSYWLSLAGGVSVSYVFLHLLPELSESQEMLADELDGLAFLEHHVYLIALIGLAVFYGLDRLALTSRRQIREQHADASTSPGVFWLHISSFAVYNLLIGYLLVHRDVPGLWSLIVFVMAMALHFVVNDYGLREHHKTAYDRIGRWVLVAAVLVGWGIGLVTEISQAAIAVLIAFLAGGIILNVLKEELPEERQSRFSAFVVGASLYAALLLAR
jgi:zinc transporter ZupT